MGAEGKAALQFSFIGENDVNMLALFLSPGAD